MNNEDIEILIINNGDNIEVQIGDDCIYKGPDDITAVLRSLGYSVEEVFSYLDNKNYENDRIDPFDFDIDESLYADDI